MLVVLTAACVDQLALARQFRDSTTEICASINSAAEYDGRTDAVALHTRSDVADEIRDYLNRVPPTEHLSSLMSNFAQAFQSLDVASGMPQQLGLSCGQLRDAATDYVDRLASGSQ